MQLSPGLVALARLIPRLFLAPAIVYVGFRAYHATVDIYVPNWLPITAYILALPVTFATSVVYARTRERRQAARHGAVLPPSIKSKWPGSLDKLSTLAWNFSNGYIAEWTDTECSENGNTINAYMLFENRIFTIEPEYVKTILATQFNSFIKGPIFDGQFHSLLGTGVFNSDGDIWKFHRSMTRPFFNKDRIGDFDIFERHAEDAINQMKVRLHEGYPVDFQDVAFRFTLDSATEFLFGKDVRSLSPGLVYPTSSPLSSDPNFLNHPSNRFLCAFTQAQTTAARRTNYGSSWRLFELWQDKVQEHMKFCFEFIDPILADSITRKRELKSQGLLDDEQGKTEVKEGVTLLEHLVNFTEDQTVIRDEILNILIAGGDTTSATLTFAIYMLSQHPDALQRLREEILTKIGDSRRPTHDDMRDMKYLRAFINETLRLYPPVPFNVRLSTNDQVWPSLHGGKPFYIPSNTMVLYCVFLMHRRKDLWGPDADLFDPDRFLDERLHKYLIPNPYIFLPFNAGPRICLGQQFAYHEVSYFLIRLLQSFDGVSLDMNTQLSPPPEWAQAKGRKALEKVVLRSHLTMYVMGGLWIKMSEASPVESV